MRSDGARRVPPGGSALALALTLWAAPALAADCAPDVADIRSGATQLRFTVEVADDEAERAQGLMNRESLPRFGGMLFVYDSARPVSFWMKNTLIPLDMLFFDETGTLVSIHANAVPHDETPIPSGEPAQFVLEINGGAAAKLGLAPGAVLRHPAVDPARAAWSCAAG
jgi:uncharacterized membrane protein (UPF0127 family)